MNTLEIKSYVLRFQTKNIFKGVYACDTLPNRFSLPALFIVNLSSKREPGSHWVLIFINKIRTCYYFDSFGMHAKNKHISFFMKKHAKSIRHNNRQLQHITSTKCGRFCCVIAATILRGKPINNLLRKFSINLFINEILIDQLFNYRI